MELYKKTASELSELLAKKEISAVELAKDVLARAEAVDDKVGAYLTMTAESALAQAEAVDAKRAAGESLSALAGIPVAIKDNICTKGTLTTCASKMLYNFKPPYNATVMDKLAACDVVVTGKVNMDEFAMGSSCENSAAKTTHNPHDLSRVPGGSSGGSAAVVAAGEVPLALGSDTGGSIRQPASFCGVVGLKPTYGAVSRYGLIAFASSLDQIGPFGRSIEDAAMLLDAITGYDPAHDSTSVKTPFEGTVRANLNPDMKGKKIGLPKEYFGEGISEEVRKAVLAAADQYKAMGAEVFEISLPLADYALPIYYIHPRPRRLPTWRALTASSTATAPRTPATTSSTCTSSPARRASARRSSAASCWVPMCSPRAITTPTTRRRVRPSARSRRSLRLHLSSAT